MPVLWKCSNFLLFLFVEGLRPGPMFSDIVQDCQNEMWINYIVRRVDRLWCMLWETVSLCLGISPQNGAVSL